MTLKLGLPSKGRLQEQCFGWFAARGIVLSRTGDAREYAASADLPGLSLVLLAAGEIPRELAAGRLHLGVTGADMLREKLPRWEVLAEDLGGLGFGHADLVIAVPRAWVDVDTLDDLDAVAAAFRAAHGHRLRIATKYHRLTREFLKAAGVADYQLVDSQGATEGTVKNLTAEAISDITTTGATLEANHLKVLADGLILASQARLFRSRTAQAGAEEAATLGALLARLDLKAEEV